MLKSSRPLSTSELSPHLYRSVWPRRFAVLSLFVAAVVIIGAGWARQWFTLPWSASGEDIDDAITAVASNTAVPHQVLAGGELQSSRAVEVVCDVEALQMKIVHMVQEGTQVKADQIVVQLDPSEISERLAKQQIQVTQADAIAKAAAEDLKIQRNLAASAVAEAELALRLAELDRKAYTQGEYQVELNDLRGSIALAETDLQEATETVDHFQMLVKKGFRSPEQLQAKRQAVAQAKYALNRDQEKLQVLENFTKERQVVELTAKAEEAVRELERSKGSATATISKAETDLEVALATAAMERTQLEKVQKQLVLCDVRAPVAGTLVYAKDKNKKIELGAPVHFKQQLFTLPDLSSMQVEAFVHESEVKKVAPGMLVTVRVDAFPNLALQGHVTDVATFYDATRHWLSGGVKEYATMVLLENLPEKETLRPGMTAQTRIQVGELSDGVVVPLTAIAHNQGTYYCYVASSAGFVRRELTLGENTENYVEVLTGLQAGERVALDAQMRQEATGSAN